MVAPMVWRRRRARRVRRATSRRCAAGWSSTSPPREAERQLKLGSGGLRDVEFAVQLLQLVHGRADEPLRRRPTLSALAALTARRLRRPRGRRGAARGLRVPAHPRAPDPAATSCAAPTSCPSDEASLRRLGRCMGFVKDPVGGARQGLAAPPPRGAPAAREALLPAAARRRSPGSPATRPGSRPRRPAARLAALGFADPQGRAAPPRGADQRASPGPPASSGRCCRRCSSGSPTRPTPTPGCSASAGSASRSARRPWYLKTLRDEGQVAERLARLLATSRYATDLLEREPQGVRMLGEDLTPRDAEAADRRDARLGRPPGRPRRGGARDPRRPPPRAVPDRGRRPVRRDRRRRRRAPGCPGSPTPPSRPRSTRSAARSASSAGSTRRRPRMAVVAMGRYGGFELSYGSDADVMFVHDPVAGRRPAGGVVVRPGRGQRAAPAARRCPAPTRALEVDADLRPEGKQGPLVRTLDSYAAYYAKWSKVWEVQALLRADAVVGDQELRRAVHRADRPAALPGRRASPTTTWSRYAGSRRASTTSGCRAAPTRNTHLKLGRGGLADIEWTVQLLQMRHAGDGARACARPRTLEALGAAARGGPARAERRRRAGARLADGEPGAQRDHAGARQGRRPAAARPARAGRGGQRPRLPAGRVRRDGQRLPADHAGRARGRGPGLLGMTASPSPGSLGFETGAAPSSTSDDGCGSTRRRRSPRWPLRGRRARPAPGWRSRPAPARRWSG